MNITPWRRKNERSDLAARPESTLARLRDEMDTLFDRFFRDPFGAFDLAFQGSGVAPRMDLVEDENELRVAVELPGVDPKDVEIDVSGGRLTIRGEKKHEKQEKRADYHYVERQFGSFQRSLMLPSTVDPDKVEATHANGVLTIRLAKHPDAKPRKIKVREA